WRFGSFFNRYAFPLSECSRSGCGHRRPPEASVVGTRQDGCLKGLGPSTMINKPTNTFCRRTRREFLWEAGAGFTGLALTGLLSQDKFFAAEPRARAAQAANPLAERAPHFAPKAKSVIFLFMYGGPSQVDTFDYKPTLYRLDGQTIPVRTFGRGGHRNEGRVVGPKWNFKRYGQSGKLGSQLFPPPATCVDR